MGKWVLSILFFLNLLVILFFWLKGSASMFGADISSNLLAIARLCGLLAVYAVLMQFVMRGRAIWVEEVFGLNNLYTAHRLNGYLVIILIYLHMTLMIISYSMIGKTDFISQIVDLFLHYDDVWQAMIAVILFTVIVGISIYIVRKRLKYETWYYVHLLTYLAVLLAWGHQLKLGSDFANQLFVYYWYALYIFVFGNVLIFRFLRQGFLFWKYRFWVENVVKEADGATSIYIGGENINRFSIEPGQFMMLRFLDKKRWWEAHPFSLSFVPKDNLLRVTVKDVGDFTHEVNGLKRGTPILLDGPLGTFIQKKAKKDKYLFIAGGVGITPIRSLVEEIAPMKKDMVLLYSNKTQEIIFKEELDKLSEQYTFPLHYIVTQDLNFKGETGRLDGEKIKKLCPDFLQRDIYLCGPAPMMEAIIHDLKQMGVPHSQMHYEKFSL
jgi:predicted ferric reductase